MAELQKRVCWFTVGGRRGGRHAGIATIDGRVLIDITLMFDMRSLEIPTYEKVQWVNGRLCTAPNGDPYTVTIVSVEKLCIVIPIN